MRMGVKIIEIYNIYKVVMYYTGLNNKVQLTPILFCKQTSLCIKSTNLHH